MTVCGLAVGTLFTLFVLPAIYTFIASDHSKPAVRNEDQGDHGAGSPRVLIWKLSPMT